MLIIANKVFKLTSVIVGIGLAIYFLAWIYIGFQIDSASKEGAIRNKNYFFETSIKDTIIYLTRIGDSKCIYQINLRNRKNQLGEINVDLRKYNKLKDMKIGDMISKKANSNICEFRFKGGGSIMLELEVEF